jgi:lysophosphatidate acyltransferase
MHALLAYPLYGFLAYTLTTISLFGLSMALPMQPLPSFLARCLSSYLSLLLSATYGVFASIALRTVGYGRISQHATGRCFANLMRLSTGVTFTIVSGQEHLTARPAVFIGNHQTELDVLFLGWIFPPYCAVTAKRSLKWVPVLGWFMALSGTVFIDRSNRHTAMAAFDGAAEEMRREGQSVFIFPEGTRSYYEKPGLLPFKKGAFHLAVKAQVPVVAVVAENYSFLLNLKRKIFRSGTIRVKGGRTPCFFHLNTNNPSTSPNPHRRHDSRKRRRPNERHAGSDVESPPRVLERIARRLQRNQWRWGEEGALSSLS